MFKKGEPHMNYESKETKILLVSSNEKEALSLTRALESLSYLCVSVLPSLCEAWSSLQKESYDIVIINYPLKDEPENALPITQSDKEDCFQNILESMYCGVILLVYGNNYYDFSSFADRFGVLTLNKPFSKQMLFQTLKLMISARKKVVKGESGKLQKHIDAEELRLINRAKFALIQHLRMDEESAHKYIEKHAMNTRKSKREIAEAIIKIYEK